jgi:glycosyltransferase involved in cell wall biosynthesis
MKIVHLTASTFLGGPERQMLGLARSLPAEVATTFLSFAEGGRCHPFLAAARRDGFEAHALENDTPHLWRAVRELTTLLERAGGDLLFCHGYKANLLGRLAARRTGIPAVAVSRGWTGENWKVRLYEILDRAHLRFMDRVVCVSAAQAGRAHRAGVRPERLRVIHNAVDPARFRSPDPRGREMLQRFFRTPRRRVIVAAGRLSPEKGFEVLAAAAARVLRSHPGVGFVLFGEGPCRERIARLVAAAGIAGAFVFGGFRSDLDDFLPHADLLVLPSFTEGMPNVVLEACAAGVPVVATAVGGTPEVLGEGCGMLVPPGDATALAAGLAAALDHGEHLRDLGAAAREYVAAHFSFAAQARRYCRLFAELQLDRAARPAEAELAGLVTGRTCEA